MKNVNKINLNILKLKKGDKILDIGCSSGEQAVLIARQGLNVYGIDSSIKYINEFKKKIKFEKRCFPKLGSATNLPFDNYFFNAVVATEVFEHISAINKSISEAFRVLKKGGRICVSVPTKNTEKLFIKIHPYWQKDSGHLNFFSEKDIIIVLKKNGFEILNVEKNNFEWSFFWLIHSFFKTRFNDSGTPLENENITKNINNFFRFLQKIKLFNLFIKLGNKLFARSYYVYAEKV